MNSFLQYPLLVIFSIKPFLFEFETALLLEVNNWLQYLHLNRCLFCWIPILLFEVFTGWTALIFKFFINKKSLLKRISTNFWERYILYFFTAF